MHSLGGGVPELCLETQSGLDTKSEDIFRGMRTGKSLGPFEQKQALESATLGSLANLRFSDFKPGLPGKILSSRGTSMQHAARIGFTKLHQGPSCGSSVFNRNFAKIEVDKK